ncbi:MAG: FIVAR domain-containing protein, partial [Bifidobacteriaceae bacterium]|nr:FIVAR domain-containing protein [Bifidobacteriaceae bacterium]
ASALTAAKAAQAQIAASTIGTDGVLAAASALNSAVAGLKTVAPAAAKDVLNSLVTEVGALNAAGYTTDSWNQLQSALSAAVVVADNANATPQDVANAALALLQAQSALKAVAAPAAAPALLPLLQATISGAQAYKGADYTTASFAALNAAIAAAQKVAKDASATDTDIAAAVVSLLKAEGALVTAPPAQLYVQVLKTHRPAISGTAKAGKTLKVKSYSSKWTSGTKLTVKWYVNGKKVKTASKLKLKSSYKGEKVVVKVTGSKTGYKSVTRASKSHKIK